VFAVAGAALVYWILRGDVARAGMSALAVLVVACPCALGLATPLALWAALARAARQGVLIRAGQVLEAMSKVRTVFFDKTGTLTQGTPALRAITCGEYSAWDENKALAWLATLESASEHPIAHAIVTAARERSLTLGAVSEFRAFPGQGATGLVELEGENKRLWAGTLGFLDSQGMDASCVASLPDAEPGETLIFLAADGRVHARAALADTVRSDAAQAITELGEAGLHLAMLSGDRRSAAEHIGRAIGLDDITAECTPQAKIENVSQRRARGDTVAVVGDGINDAPALAAADVGIAIGGGTDLAREVSDVTLLGDRLLQIPWALRLARRTQRTIRQNLTWAFGYNVIAMTLAFLGYLHPLLAAGLMLGSNVFVLHNSLRLGRSDAAGP